MGQKNNQVFSLRNTIHCNCKVWNLRWGSQVSWIIQQRQISLTIITDLQICIFVGSPDIFALLSTNISVQINIFGNRFDVYSGTSVFLPTSPLTRVWERMFRKRKRLNWPPPCLNKSVWHPQIVIITYHYLSWMQIAHEKCQMTIYEFQWSRAAKFACWIFKYLFFQCSMADHLNIPVLQLFQWFSAEEERGGESLQVVRGRLWNVRLLTGQLHQYCTARLIPLTI